MECSWTKGKNIIFFSLKKYDDLMKLSISWKKVFYGSLMTTSFSLRNLLGEKSFWLKMFFWCSHQLENHFINKPQSIETEPLANALKFLFGRWRSLEFMDWNQFDNVQNQLKCLFSNIKTLLLIPKTVLLCCWSHKFSNSQANSKKQGMSNPNIPEMKPTTFEFSFQIFLKPNIPENDLFQKLLLDHDNYVACGK